MARVDDYFNSKKIAVEKLSKQSFETLLNNTKFQKLDKMHFTVPLFNRTYKVSFSDFNFVDISDVSKEVPIQEQVLVLHYMLNNCQKPISGNIKAYREIPDASFYFNAFASRALEPLKKVFGNNISGFSKASNILNGKKVENGDAGFEFMVFPKTPIQIIMWEEDEEFGSDASILFDETIKDILSAEDIAWLASLLAYRLISISYA